MMTVLNRRGERKKESNLGDTPDLILSTIRRRDRASVVAGRKIKINSSPLFLFPA